MRLLVLSFFAVALFAASLSLASGPGEMTFSYTGASAVRGGFEGGCLAAAVLPAGDAITLRSEGGTLTTRFTRVNYTVIDDLPMPEPDKQWSTGAVIPGGALRLVMTGGLATILPSGAERLDGHPVGAALAVTFATETVESTAPRSVTPPGSFEWTGEEGARPVLYDPSFPASARGMDIDGEPNVEGDVTLYLRAVVLETATGTIRLDPWTTYETDIGGAGIAHRTVRFADAYLRLQGANAALPGGSRIMCGPLEGDVDGTFTASSATGTVSGPDGPIAFERRVLSIEGEFHLAETGTDVAGPGGSEGHIDAKATGRFDTLGLDFSRVSSDEPPTLVVAASAFVLLAVLLAPWKWAGHLVGLLYSRIAGHAVLDNGNRDLVYQAILHNPGIDLSGLKQLTPFHLSTVAYHVGVLRRAGLIDKVRHGYSTRFVARGTLVDPDQVVLAHDEALRFIVERIKPAGGRQGDLVRELRERFGVTRQAAHLMVRRAIDRRLVVRDGAGRDVVIRCVS